MYNLGFLVFTVGSLLCGLALNLSQLVGFRVLQAVGGALVSANSGAIIADTFPPAERGRAYGLTAVGWNAGAVVGIVLGGFLVTFASWRLIFLINVPVGIAALVVGFRVLRERSPRVTQKLDLPGAALLGAGLLLVLFALTGMAGTGWTSRAAAQLAAGGALLAGFVLRERRCEAPLLDLSLLRRRVLTASVFAAFFQALGAFAVMFLVIMYLQGVRGLSPLLASVLLLPGNVLGGLLGPWAGRVADRRGARLPASAGLAIQACGVLVYASLTPGAPLGTVVAGAVVNGLGSSLFFPANNSAVMADAPPQAYGVASGLLRTLSNVGMVSSFAVALLAAAAAIPRTAAFAIFLGTSRLSPPLAGAFVRGMHAALLTSLVLLSVAFVLSLLRGREARAQSARA
jgi:EmrB/QacA subfamily drug resistance transporter